VRLSPLGTSSTNWPIVPAPDDDDDDDECGAVGGMRIGRGNWSTQRKPATLSTTNPTWPDLGLNPFRRSGKPVTNCLSYGTALCSPRRVLSCSLKDHGKPPSHESTSGFSTGPCSSVHTALSGHKICPHQAFTSLHPDVNSIVQYHTLRHRCFTLHIYHETLHLRFLWWAGDMNTKMTKILNGGNFTGHYWLQGHWNWLLNEGNY
jgi:hypothetical protein